MATLPKELRGELAKTVTKARDAAEKGARKALEALAVDRPDAFAFMNEGQKALRKHLRAHGRQLGDTTDSKKAQTIDHLALECAYEQWHRMLFARFLAENDLLIEPETNVAIALEECRELALERGVDWLELASEFAVRMLPQIFRADNPVLAVTLPIECRQDLERLLKSLPREVFVADDSLGWVYQFWQAKKKNAVNESGAKIGADELPAVTQLFTEDYMVLFLLHNTIGAWWAGKVLKSNPDLATCAEDEDELRAACAVGGVEWRYLRFLKNDDGWRPAAGTFDGWPHDARDITVLDPCMGSGHFLVFALPILAAIRAEEESLSNGDALLAVLRDNLYGLELDPRCTQIAAFNLALATWKETGYRSLPPLRLASSGLAISASEREWVELAGTDARARESMAQLFAIFKQAPMIGSLINPRRFAGNLFAATFETIRPTLERALAAQHEDLGDNELAVSARGLLEATQLLAGSFTLVTTNVPYLGQGSHSPELAEYLERAYPTGKRDVANAFVERCLAACHSSGTIAVVTQRACTYLTTDEGFRRSILLKSEINSVSAIGPRGFQTISGERVDVILLIVSARRPAKSSRYSALDVSPARTPADKSRDLRLLTPEKLLQSEAEVRTDATIVVHAVGSKSVFGRIADCYQGLSTADSLRFLRRFWEFVSVNPERWEVVQGPPEQTGPVGGLDRVVDKAVLRGDVEGSAVRGREAWGRRGVAIGQMTHVPATLYSGIVFLDSAPVIVPKRDDDLALIWSFCSSVEFCTELRKINPKLSVNNGYVSKMPFDPVRWREVAASISLPDATESSDPHEAIFSGHPGRTVQTLQVATCRLLGYRWPRQTGSGFPGCPNVAKDGLESHSDEDGIVGLPALRGERSAAEQLHGLVATAFGADWSVDRLAILLSEAGFGGRSLDIWLRDGFFEQHCALFDQTPFLWHLWDGTKDGFHVLVNYHRLAGPDGEGRRTLEKVIYTYLREWIEQQRHGVQSGAEGAEGRLAAAEHLRDELLRIVDGEPPYDLFVRWKPLHEQPIGWDPDIDDGVRVNIRPFMAARTLNGKPILRIAPKISWGKDRGKEPVRPIEDYPWFWGWDESSIDFEGNPSVKPVGYGKRWNDLHYTREFKQAARERYASDAAEVAK
jgi:hypothetical protein